MAAKKDRVLWADDEIDLLKPHILFLQDKGYEVVPVVSGQDAIDCCKEQSFDIIFLDENMPGLTGLETLSHIKEIDPNIKAGLLIGTPRNTIIHRLNEYFPLHRLHVCKADFISPHFQFVTREFLLRMHLHRKEVYAWTVNDIAKMSKLIRKGVDGIITDRPDFGLQARMAFE